VRERLAGEQLKSADTDAYIVDRAVEGRRAAVV